MIPIRSALAFTTALVLCLPAARAQTGNPLELTPIILDAEGVGGEATGPLEGYVAETTATGLKTPGDIADIPQSVSVVTRRQIEDRGVERIDEALNYSAGVFSQPFGTDPRFVSPILRGFTAANNVFLNSFRFGRNFGALSFEPFGLERLEVLRGPASVLYGNAAPGGIVNLVQKRPYFEDGGQASLAFGSYDRVEGALDVNKAVDETLALRLTTLGRIADAQQDTLSDDRFYVAPALTWTPDARTSVTLLAQVQRDEAGSPMGLPLSGTLNPNPYGEVSEEVYLGEPGFDSSDSLFAAVGYEARHEFAPGWEVRQNAQYLWLDFDYRNLYFSSLAADDRTVNRGASVQTEDYAQLGVDTQLAGELSTGPLEHELLFGVDYRRIHDDRSSTFDFSVAPIDLFNPVYGAPIVIDAPFTSLTDAALSQVGLYAQDQIRFDRLLVSLGLRHDWSDIDYDAGGSDQDDRAFTWRAGASYEAPLGLHPYASWSTSFDPQIGTTTAGDAFEPSEGEQFEIGVKWRPRDYESFVTLSAFDLTRTNVSNTTATDVGGVITPITDQTGEIQVRGIELEAVASLARGLSLAGSYTWTDAEITEGADTVVGGVVTATTTGNEPANVPEHMAKLWVDYAFAPAGALGGFSVGGGVRYLGERYGNDANTIEVPSATLFDAAIRYRIDRTVLSLNVNNIADERHIASCNFGCFYGEGRTFLARLSYEW